MTTPAPDSALPPDRAHISTERRNPRTMNLHALSVEECLTRINLEDRHAFDAVKRATPRITAFVETIEPGFVAGGRLIYVGAGTSGRLGVLDASEAPPTFQVPPDRIIGIIAGGDGALRKSSEAKEDDPRGSWAELEALKLTSRDAVVAIAAGGTTPFALGALEFCKSLGESAPVTALLCCTTIDRPPPLRSSHHAPHGARGPDGLDAHEGGHGDQAHAQHDLDDADDPLGTRLPEPDGGPQGHQRETP